MTLPHEAPLAKLQFYVTAPYNCGYLPNKQAQSLIATPQHTITSNVYNHLIQQGFRRSGKFVYRPHCELCQACVPVRIVLEQFSPNRSQKRAFQQHHMLRASIKPLQFIPAHFALYETYQMQRHAENLQHDIIDDKNEAEQYRQFLCQSNVDSLMIEFSDETGEIKIVSVVDVLNDGVSAVYTFYNPHDKASYGTYAIMWLAEWTRTLGLDYLYLGYWIKNSQKMSYKQAFKPQQRLIEGEWLMVD